jgi:hypothetical protein
MNAFTYVLYSVLNVAFSESAGETRAASETGDNLCGVTAPKLVA